MDLNFKEELPDGTVEFYGSFDKEEVDFLLKYAILHLMSSGISVTTDLLKTPIERGHP